jgi:hypothetical protein
VARRFFPLDHRLQLRADHYSEGAAQVASEQGLQAQSFERAAVAYRRAVGGAISDESIRRICEGFGRAVAELRQAEAQAAMRLPLAGEKGEQERIAQSRPITTQANLSSDGVYLLLRQEGWKEVKLSVISEVTVAEASQRPAQASRRQGDPLVRLHNHSYQAGLWEADTFASYQYAEGLRRDLAACPTLTSVNDGALWIERITQENFPTAIQIVDWSHAASRIASVAALCFGDSAAQTQPWVQAQLDQLWQGHPSAVASAISRLASTHDFVRQSKAYFEANLVRMDYATYRSSGFPIGSGTAESGAKNLVQQRMKRPGPGWSRPNAQAMLAALSELYSARFDQIWRALY